MSTELLERATTSSDLEEEGYVLVDDDEQEPDDGGQAATNEPGLMWIHEDAVDQFVSRLIVEDLDPVRAVIEVLEDSGRTAEAEQLRRRVLVDDDDDWLRDYVSERWADDWASDEDSVYDSERDAYDPR